MRFDPLTTYSSLIPGALHYVPGGLCLPPQARMRNEDALPDQTAPRLTRSVKAKDGIWASLWKTCAAAFSLALP